MDYPEDSAGGIMQKEVHVKERSRRLANRFAATKIKRTSADHIYVVDDEGRPERRAAVARLVFQDLRLLVRDVMITWSDR